MKRKFISIVLTLVICLTVAPSTTAFALTDGDYEYELLNNEVTILRYLGSGGDIIIPSSIQGRPVTKIGSYGAFGYSVLSGRGVSKEVREAILSVTIPSTVTDMSGSGIFEGCVNLSIVVIPNSVTVLGDSTFKGCTSLKYVDLPDSINKIGRSTFSNCTSLTKISWPKGINQIPEGSPYSGTWEGCTGLKEVVIPDGIEVIGSSAFSKCTSLTTVSFPDSVKTIGGGAFYGCTALNKVNMNLGLETIGLGAFEHCESLKNVVIPTTVKSIGYIAFTDCPIEEIIIPYGVEDINNSTFYRTSKNTTLKAVYLPSTIRENTMWGMYEGNYPNMICYAPENSFAAKNCARWNRSYITDNSCDSPIHVVYNGSRISFDQNPTIIDGRTLVPLRAIFEAMGAEVDWDDKTQTVTAKRGNTTISLSIGSNSLHKNEDIITLDVEAGIINGRTMVPARAIAESFGANVEWNGVGGIVFINE